MNQQRTQTYNGRRPGSGCKCRPSLFPDLIQAENRKPLLALGSQQWGLGFLRQCNPSAKLYACPCRGDGLMLKAFQGSHALFTPRFISASHAFQTILFFKTQRPTSTDVIPLHVMHVHPSFRSSDAKALPFPFHGCNYYQPKSEPIYLVILSQAFQFKSKNSRTF